MFDVGADPEYYGVGLETRMFSDDGHIIYPLINHDQPAGTVI